MPAPPSPSAILASPDGGAAVLVEADNVASEPSRPLWMNAALVSLLLRDGLLLHAAGAVLEGRGMAILGTSGTGKSTLSRRIEARCPDSVLCDERIAVRADGAGGWTVAGTPWASTAGIARRRSVPLSALVFLEQHPVNDIRPLRREDALGRILPMASIPWQEDELASRGSETLDRLLRAVPSFVYRVANSASAADHLAAWAATLPPCQPNPGPCPDARTD